MISFSKKKHSSFFLLNTFSILLVCLRKLDSLAKANVVGGKTQEEYKAIANDLMGIFKQGQPLYQPFQDAKQKGDVATQQKIQQQFEPERRNLQFTSSCLPSRQPS